MPPPRPNPPFLLSPFDLSLRDTSALFFKALVHPGTQSEARADLDFYIPRWIESSFSQLADYTLLLLLLTLTFNTPPSVPAINQITMLLTGCTVCKPASHSNAIRSNARILFFHTSTAIGSPLPGDRASCIDDQHLSRSETRIVGSKGGDRPICPGVRTESTWSM